MLLVPQTRKADLPSSLVVGGPLSRSYQDITCLSSDFSSPRHIRSLSQGAQCVELADNQSSPSPGMPPRPDNKGSKPTLDPLWKKQKRSSLHQNLDEGTNEGTNNGGSVIEDSPSSLLPTPASHWRLRRVVSATTFSPENTSSSQRGSPTSPRSSHWRPSHIIGSFIRRHLLEQESAPQGGVQIPHSLRPGHTTAQPALTINSCAQDTESTHSQSNYSSPTATLSPDAAPPCTSATNDSRRLLPGLPTTYSPVAANPFDAWQGGRARPEPSSSWVSTPAAPALQGDTTSMMFERPQPAGGFPAPMAPTAPHTAPIMQTPFLDTKSPDAAGGPAEPEGLDSPSEFALFAAATSSFDFLPSTFDPAGSPVSSIDDGGPLASSSKPLEKRPRPGPPRLSLTTTFSAAAAEAGAPRSRSVPPPASPSDPLVPLPLRFRNRHGHRLSHAAAPFPAQQQQYQHHQHRHSHHQVPTAAAAHLAVQALLGSGDARLEDHHQHQHHPRHSQTFPGASSTAAAAASSLAASMPGSNNDSIASLPPTTPPSPRAKLDDDLDAFVTANHDDDPPDGEELPDYATSQAQATARQRTEATRRARELEEGWLRGRAERARRPWRAWEHDAGW